MMNEIASRQGQSSLLAKLGRYMKDVKNEKPRPPLINRVLSLL